MKTIVLAAAKGGTGKTSLTAALAIAAAQDHHPDISVAHALMFNTTATVIGMVHMMLPLLVFPLYGSMRAFNCNCISAAASLGASPLSAFWRVYFRLSLPGLAAGTFLIFVISLGFFITRPSSAAAVSP